jgi:uncharacterized protein YacL
MTIIGMVAGYGVFLLIGFIGVVSRAFDTAELNLLYQSILIAACAIIFGLIFFLLTPAIGKQSAKVARYIEAELQTVPANDIIVGTGGLVIGLLIAFLLSQIFRGMGGFLEVGLNIVVFLVLGYLGVVVATRKGRDIMPTWVSMIKSSQGKNKSKGGADAARTDAAPKILDTSVIIDGRIADIMKTGFIEGNIVIPEFVLVELRHIADSSDSLKRNRGRRGLDVLNRIQTEHGVEIYNTETDKSLNEIPEVDVKLLKLAQILHGKVVTNDYNLNKVAVIKGVSVLNINELANTLKPVVLPGEEMNLFLIKEGKEYNQAVAYLDDGTMIVVEEGRKFIGKTVDVNVTSVLQTSAGRMIFAKPKGK